MQILRHAHPRRLDLKAGVPPVLLGFLATSFQIYLLREFDVRFFGNELTFGFVLGAWLLWGGIGSLIRPRSSPALGRLARLYSLTGFLFLISLGLLRFSHNLLGILPGELTGLSAALGFALGLGLLVSLPLGMAFVMNSYLLDGGVARVYLLESLGATLAGLSVHFLLIPHFSNWQAAAILMGISGLVVFLTMRRRRAWVALSAALAAAAALALLDFPSQRAAWKPLALVRAEDTRYGKLQVVRTADQYSLYSNGLPLFTYPNAAAAEECVHFALLQRPAGGLVLLIGGGAGGAVQEILKYPSTRVDYVEPDPAVIRLAESFLPEAGISALKDRRVHVIHEDGRSFLHRTTATYDAIILNLPEPATAQINRFYTTEFFREARQKLTASGVVSFTVPSAENYISRDLQHFLATLYRTLAGVFPEVAVVPGEDNTFLASGATLTLDPERLSEAIGKLGLQNKFVSPQMLPARLNPARVATLKDKISGDSAPVNSDLVPTSYFFQSVLWASQFKGLESWALRLFARLSPFWVLDVPLIAAAIVLASLALKRRQAAFRFLAPVALMGFTSITVEMAVLIMFQASFGYVYGRIALLLASFMAGLFTGALAGLTRKRPRPVDLAAVQAGFAVMLLLTMTVLMNKRGSEILPFLVLATFGVLSGYLFIAANRLFLKESVHPGIGYGADLLGSFLGVVLAASVVIPLFGIPLLLSRLALLNVLGFFFAVAVAARRGTKTVVA